jgi:hypothetical protein
MCFRHEEGKREWEWEGVGGGKVERRNVGTDKIRLTDEVRMNERGWGGVRHTKPRTRMPRMSTTSTEPETWQPDNTIIANFGSIFVSNYKGRRGHFVFGGGVRRWDLLRIDWCGI